MYHGDKETDKHSTLDIDMDININIDMSTHTLHICIQILHGCWIVTLKNSWTDTHKNTHAQIITKGISGYTVL